MSEDLPIKGRQLTCLDWGLYLDFEMSLYTEVL